VASGPSHHTAEQRGERASLFDHLVGTERQCWRDVLGKWGEVNFLLTTPKCRARMASYTDTGEQDHARAITPPALKPAGEVAECFSEAAGRQRLREDDAGESAR
jgi:hypothetical protein